VNTFQLIVMLAGLLIALPVAMGSAGGFAAISSASVSPQFGDILHSSGSGSGWTLLFLLGPAFIISPGLIQKAYGGASASAVRTGVALNAIGLLTFAFVPVLFGMIARTTLPGITDANAVLPTVLTHALPPWLGAIALAAVFSTEVDTCDAILFMLSTSASKDLYKRFLNPGASDAQLLRVGRATAVAGGAIGVLLSIWLQTVIGAITVFYSLLVVTLFVPVIGGLYVRRAQSREAMAAVAAGVATLIVVRFGVAGAYPWVDPALSGIIASAVAFYGALALRPRRALGIEH
jgi:SSS family solute:Na+ symporter